MNDHALIAFDLDGTLADTRRDLASAVNSVRRDFGAEALSLETATGYLGNGARVLMERAMQGLPCDLDAAVALMKRYYSARLAMETNLFPGVAETLAWFKKRGFVLGVVSNKPEGPAIEVLRELGILEYFAEVVGGSERFPLKPDPAGYFHLLAAHGCEASRSWMIGDHWTDLELARRAGARSVFMRYGFGNVGRETPTAFADGFAELPGIVG